MAAQRGDVGDALKPAPAVREPILLGLMMLFGAASAAGLPPLPGFLGKLMILQSSHGLAAQPWVWTVILVVGFLGMVGLARAGVVLFWHVQPTAKGASASGSSAKMLTATWAFIAMTVVLAVVASPVKQYTDATAAQLADRAAYQRAVLGDLGNSTRPYTGER
jgi:multicomponent K+:H+ antiporter subunit D